MHFGRSPGDADRDAERDLIALIKSVRPKLDGLYLVGDVFEHYLEYRHVIPKGHVRFQAMLADLTDTGIPVTYLVGNHDPWHRDYFKDELGVDIVFDHIVSNIYHLNVYVSHGDGLGPDAGVYPLLKPVLRHRIPVGLFQGLLPADLGMGIAKWYSRNFRSEEVNDARTGSLRKAALELLDGNSYDLVVMGHSHKAELLETDRGTYVNCGCWYSDRTIAVLDEGGPAIKRWTGTELVDCEL